MNRLKHIQYNCKQATFLIEKKQIAPLTLGENLALKIHLAGCSACRIFQRQSTLINRLLHNLFNIKAQNPPLTLDESFKNELQRRIEKELENK